MKKELSVNEKTETDNIITNEDINGEGTVQEDNIEIFYND